MLTLLSEGCSCPMMTNVDEVNFFLAHLGSSNLRLYGTPATFWKMDGNAPRNQPATSSVPQLSTTTSAGPTKVCRLSFSGLGPKTAPPRAPAHYRLSLQTSSRGLWPLSQIGPVSSSISGGSNKGSSSFLLWPVAEDCASASACSYALQLLATSY